MEVVVVVVVVVVGVVVMEVMMVVVVTEGYIRMPRQAELCFRRWRWRVLLGWRCRWNFFPGL